MAMIPTISVTKGGETIRINAVDIENYKRDGWVLKTAKAKAKDEDEPAKRAKASK